MLLSQIHFDYADWSARGLLLSDYYELELIEELSWMSCWT